MNTTSILFFYHWFWGFTISLAISLGAAYKVAKQSTLVNDYTGRSMTIFKVDRREFFKTWGLFTASGTFLTLVILLLRETQQYMQDAGYIS